MTTHLSENEKNNPFMSDSFDIDDLSLITEAIGLFIENDSRLMYNAPQIMEVAKIEDETKRMQALSLLKQKYEGQPLSDEELDRLLLIDNLVLDAMGAKEAEDEVGAVIYSLEQHLKNHEGKG
jgi:hypothetical protein